MKFPTGGTVWMKEDSRKPDDYTACIIGLSLSRKGIIVKQTTNVRMPGLVIEEFLQVLNEYLRMENESRGVVNYKDLKPVQDGIYLWQWNMAFSLFKRANNSEIEVIFNVFKDMDYQICRELLG